MCECIYVCLWKWCNILKYTKIAKRVKLISLANMVPAHHSFGIISAPLLSGYVAFPGLCFISKVSQSSHASLHETQSDKCILQQVCHCESQTATASLGDRILWDHHRICDLAMIKMSRCGLQLCVSTCRHAFFIDYTTSCFQLVVKEASY